MCRLIQTDVLLKDFFSALVRYSGIVREVETGAPRETELRFVFSRKSFYLCSVKKKNTNDYEDIPYNKHQATGCLYHRK